MCARAAGQRSAVQAVRVDDRSGARTNKLRARFWVFSTTYEEIYTWHTWRDCPMTRPHLRPRPFYDVRALRDACPVIRRAHNEGRSRYRPISQPPIATPTAERLPCPAEPSVPLTLAKRHLRQLVHVATPPLPVTSAMRRRQAARSRRSPAAQTPRSQAASRTPPRGPSSCPA